MRIKKEVLEVVGAAMLDRQTHNSLNPVKWHQLMPESKAGYIEDARVAIEAYLEIYNVKE